MLSPEDIILKPLCIGNVKIDPPLILAPLAEITDIHFRPLLKKLGGIGLVVSEMISSEGVSRFNQRSLELMKIDPAEHPIALQIYGSDPERMAVAARLGVEAGADIIDINFGCPSKNVTRNNGGVAMMRQIDCSVKIIRAVKNTVDVPVMVKFRLGWNVRSKNHLEFGLAAAEAGADALTLHARTAKAGFSGEVEKDAWKELANNSPVPIIANGNISSVNEAAEAFLKYGCGGIMIGRAALKNPFIFRTIIEGLNGHRFKPGRTDYASFLIDYYNAIKKKNNAKFLLHKLRIMSGWLSCGLEMGACFREKINSISDPILLLEEFSRFADFNTPINYIP